MKRSSHESWRHEAFRLSDRYGFGARLISRMILVDHGVQVPFYTVQKWLARRPA